jgi:hypothetical protein
VLEAARHFFIPVVHSPLGPWGTWEHRSSPLGKAMSGPRVSAGAYLDREARSRAEKHVAAPEPGAVRHVATPKPTSVGRRGPELRNAWRHRSLTQRGDEARGHGPLGSTGAHLSKEVRSRVAGHVTAPERTSIGKCGLKLQLAWQRVDAHLTPYLDLELVCGGTRSSGCRQPARRLGVALELPSV